VPDYADRMRVIPDRSTITSLADHTRFTGRVWRTDYIKPVDLEHLAGSRFLYEPGARSFWHVHEREQAIVATLGSGLVAWEGLDAPVALAVGDWWHVQPGVPHWHGAAPGTAFAHLALTAGGTTSWLHEVTDEHYRAASARPVP
jgi:quercetin dioxygenase-like cupin family protein